MWERIEVEGKPALKDPVLIVSLSTNLSQYRAMYSQAKELANFMLQEMEFTRIATIYSSAFPPVAVISDDGIVRLSSAEFYSHPGSRDVAPRGRLLATRRPVRVRRGGAEVREGARGQ